MLARRFIWKKMQTQTMYILSKFDESSFFLNFKTLQDEYCCTVTTLLLVTFYICGLLLKSECCLSCLQQPCYFQVSHPHCVVSEHKCR